MEKLFELDWLGGPAEAHFRRRRPGIDQLPWGTLHPKNYPEELVQRARLSWTRGAFQEYCTAAAFAEIIRALLALNAPIDLIGMAGEFIADEMLHTELNARMAMELGGAPPCFVDFDRLSPKVSDEADALSRANELILRTCCIGETFSIPALSGTMRVANHPLTRAVLERIVQDEAPHARLGWLYFEWCQEQISAEERLRLAKIAKEEIASLSPLWKSPPEESNRYSLSDIYALGWMEANNYAAHTKRATQEHIITPLRRLGIEVTLAD